MKLPNAERAVVDMRKLTDYCLNMEHRLGAHKARVFAAALGITVDNAALLREALLEAARMNDARLGRKDEYGQRYVVDFILSEAGRPVPVRSVWIVKPDEDFPRLTSCYVL